MLSGLAAFNSTFLLDLNATENNLTQINKQISSGTRVNQASDDPAAIASILSDQDQIAQTTQVQTNLQLAATHTNAADQALSSAASLLNQLTSIATQGATSSSTATTRAILGQQVKGIEQQLVNLANTSIGGRYIFGGDNPSIAPYTFSDANGAVPSGSASNTLTIQDANGQTIVPTMTAQKIFDLRNEDGTPATGNLFQAAFALGQALLNSDQPGIQASVSSLGAASVQLEQATAFYGNTENWIQNATAKATSTLTDLQTEVSSLKDTDIAAAATQLTTEQTALQAALAAHGSLSVKSLFDYMA